LYFLVFVVVDLGAASGGDRYGAAECLPYRWYDFLYKSSSCFDDLLSIQSVDLFTPGFSKQVRSKMDDNCGNCDNPAKSRIKVARLGEQKVIRQQGVSTYSAERNTQRVSQTVTNAVSQNQNQGQSHAAFSLSGLSTIGSTAARQLLPVASTSIEDQKARDRYFSSLTKNTTRGFIEEHCEYSITLPLVY
jgi:hypothetical protein